MELIALPATILWPLFDANKQLAVPLTAPVAYEEETANAALPFIVESDRVPAMPLRMLPPRNADTVPLEDPAATAAARHARDAIFFVQ